jgi:hypothetical protein
MENLNYDLLRFKIGRKGNFAVDSNRNFSTGSANASLSFTSDSLKKKLLYLVKCQVSDVIKFRII